MSLLTQFDALWKNSQYSVQTGEPFLSNLVDSRVCISDPWYFLFQENVADTILVSDSFHALTRDKCTYESGTSLFIPGQGILNSAFDFSPMEVYNYKGATV
jgi:hypothetical protein